MPGDENAAQNAAPDAAQTNNKPPGLSKPKATEDSEYRALMARHADLKSLLEVGGLVGTGSFGTVHTARWRDGRRSQPVVIKVVHTTDLSAKAQRQLRREVLLHAVAVHQHICPLLGSYESGGEVHLVLRACVGDLGAAIAAGVPWLKAAAPWMMKSLLLALQFLHAEPVEVCHADIKPANLLLDDRGVWLLSDLGAASRCHTEGRSTLVGSPAYRAPEVIAIDHLGLGLGGARYSFPSDLWSSGVLLFEALSGGALPFPADGRDATVQPAAVVFGSPSLDAIGDGTARRLLLQLLVKQPYLRPTAEEALASAYVLEAAPPTPTEVDERTAAVRRLSRAEQEWWPTPRKPSAQGLSAAEESGSDDSPGPPSWASSLVGGPSSSPSPSPCA